MRIVLIGAGKVAWNLAHALTQAGHSLTGVYSRTSAHAQALAKPFPRTEVYTQPDLRQSGAQLVLVCVKDDALEDLARQIVLPAGIPIAHTSGTCPLEILKNFEHAGVFYPVQTFSEKRLLDWSALPIVLEASDKTTEEMLTQFAQSLSSQIFYLNSERRKVLHLSAVFANNFTNYLYHCAYRILETEKLDNGLLQALIKETAAKALALGPLEAQTGPARRGDREVMEAHLTLLQQDPALQVIYRQISQQIQTNYTD